MTKSDSSRRAFILATAAGASTVIGRWALPHTASAETTTSASATEKSNAEPAVTRIGLMADVHKDVMHDANERLTVFVEKMLQWKPDFVLQMGDFCIPIAENQSFMDIWNQLPCPRHHVLGNHDMDGDGKTRPDEVYAFKREETMEFWGMQGRYYSFDYHGGHYVILDGNDQGPGQEGYFRYVGDDQAEWFAQDLAGTKLPTFVFIHQSLEREKGGVENQQAIRKLMEQATDESGVSKVVACFSGHHHRDYVRRINEIIYPQINSMSYYWLGGNYLQVRYSDEIDRQYPYIKYTVPYKDPLYAMVTIDRQQGFLQIEGTQSKFVGPSPWEQGASEEELESHSLLPSVSDWKIPI